MSSPARFPYIQVVPGIGAAGWMPLVPVVLTGADGSTLSELALVDSGSATSVMPFQLGVQLGGNWNQFPGNIPLGGMLANHQARPLFLELTIAPFAPVRMSFAWSRAPTARLLLGQTNFFQEFDVCLFGSRSEF